MTRRHLLDNPDVEHGLSDTASDVAAVHRELRSRASPERRLRLAFSLSRTVLGLAKDRLARTMPDASEEEVGLRFLALLYGASLADEVRDYLVTQRSRPS